MVARKRQTIAADPLQFRRNFIISRRMRNKTRGIMNIDKMTYAELTELNARVTKALPDARVRELEAIRKTVTDLVAARGFSVTDLLSAREFGALIDTPIQATTKRPRKAKAATKMRDAKGVIWAGRGRQPKGFDKASAVAA